MASRRLERPFGSGAVAVALGLSFALALAVAQPARAQSRVQVFRDAEDGSVEAMLPLPGGGLVLLGVASGSPWLAELSPTGEVLRQVRLVGASAQPTIEAMAPTPEGGLVLAGWIAVSATSNPMDAFVVKLDPGWTIEWQVSYGVPDRNEIVYGIQPLPDGGWLVHGNSSGALVMRLDAQGTVAWERSYSVATFRYALSVDGNMVSLGSDRWLLAGRQSGSDGRFDQVLIAEFLTDGTVVGARLLDTPDQDHVADVQALADGSAWIVGTMRDPASTPHMAVLRLHPDGTTAWVRGIRCSAVDPDAREARTTPAGGIVIGANLRTGPRDYENAVLELDRDGQPVRLGVFGGVESDYMRCFAGSDLGWVVGGHTLSLDGPAQPFRAWAVVLDDALVPPDVCGLRSADTTSVVDLFPSETPVQLVGTLATTAVASGATVTIERGVVASTVECLGGIPPPREVSPPCAATPLRVQAGGVITWEDGALSRSDEFDVHRGIVSALRGSGDYGACWATHVSATTETDPSLPGAGASWFYLVVGRNAAGLGPLGIDSLGRARIPPAWCP